MFRVRRNILDSLRFQKKRFARYFSTPSLPEFADVVIIGKECAKKSKGKVKSKKTVAGKAILKRRKENFFKLNKITSNWILLSSFGPFSKKKDCEVNERLPVGRRESCKVSKGKLFLFFLACACFLLILLLLFATLTNFRYFRRRSKWKKIHFFLLCLHQLMMLWRS